MMADNLDVNHSTRLDPIDLVSLAKSLVYDEAVKTLEKTDTQITFARDEVYVVWFCFTLGNWKALCSTTLPDGRYYEVTYNQSKYEAYVDTYDKINNVAYNFGDFNN
jgi:hypothetical protein